MEPLTPREIEILECAALDLSMRQTALRLCIAIETVRFHRKTILRKMGCRSMTGAVGRWQAEKA